MKKLFCIKSIVFITGLVIIFNLLTMIFVQKTYPMNADVNSILGPYVLAEKQNGFYNLEENTLDVLFIGSSHVHCNINPNVLYHEYGIAAYDFSSDTQELGTSYYYLKQAVKMQSPKIVVIDINDFGGLKNDSLMAHFAFDNFKNDFVRFDAINNRVNNTFVLETQLPVIAYHSRWKELTSDDFLYIFKRKEHNSLSGSFIYMLETPVEYVTKNFDENNSEELSKTEIDWIYKIIQLCDENDIELLFSRTPQDSYETGKYICFKSFCDENNISFLWMDTEIDEIGLDFNVDYADGEHANFKGQEKITKYIGRYLKNNYDIPDRRGEEKYKYFENDYDVMMEIINNYWNKYYI